MSYRKILWHSQHSQRRSGLLIWGKKSKNTTFCPCVTEALNFQHKLDETTKLLLNLQEAQRERLSIKQPPNMIYLLAPTAKEMELCKNISPKNKVCSIPVTVCVAPLPPLKVEIWTKLEAQFEFKTMVEQHCFILCSLKKIWKSIEFILILNP